MYTYAFTEVGAGAAEEATDVGAGVLPRKRFQTRCRRRRPFPAVSFSPWSFATGLFLPLVVGMGAI